jgi:polyisoprenoid-binding protein YceI
VSRAVLTAVAALALMGPARAEPTWEIDPSHSAVQFSVRHLMISNVRGEFGRFTGSVTGDAAKAPAAVVEARIEAASIDTREPKRDAHLKSPDFLDVERHPTITFVSKRIEPAGAGRWKMSGDLTLHGVTREVVLDVEGPTRVVKDPMGNVRAGARATTTLNRKDFGITWAKAMDGGGVVVGDEVRVTIDVEGVQKAAAGG